MSIAAPAAPTSALATNSVYFYGVVRGDHAGVLAGVTPIDGEGDVYGIAYRDLTVMVSDARKPRYEVSRKNVLGHEAVVTALMAAYTLLPARFGRLRHLDEIVDELLVRFYEPLHAQLDYVQDRVELGLIVRWSNVQSMVAEIVATDPWLHAAGRQMAASRSSQNLRLEVGKRMEQALVDKRMFEGAQIVAALTPLVARDGVHINDYGDEVEVLNALFLVSRDQVDAFTAAVLAYDRGCGSRYLMAVGAPTAPYGFVPLLEASTSGDDHVLGRARVRR